MPVVAVLGRFVAVKGVKRDGKRMVAVIERDHVREAFRWDEVENVVENIRVRFDEGKAGPGRDVVRDHVEHEGGLTFIRFTNHVDRLAAVGVSERHRFVLIFLDGRDE
jgi:hypothetical protein